MSKNIPEKIGAGRVVAVAIENNKTSQYAAKWAVDNLLPKDQCLLLIYVRQKAASIPTTMGNLVPVNGNDDIGRAYKQQMDNESRELFSLFRVFCNRKRIQCKEIILEDMDISKALIESCTKLSIELLVLGAPSRSGLVRRFRTSDIPNQVAKGVPPFCTVYIIAKGKISSVRAATSTLVPKPVTPPNNSMQNQPQLRNSPSCGNERANASFMRNVAPTRCSTEKQPGYIVSQLLNDEEIKSPFTRPGRASHKQYEPSISEFDISFVSSTGGPSTDRMFPSLYEEMDSGTIPRFSVGSDYDMRSFASSYSGAKSIEIGDYSFSSQDSGISSGRISLSDDVEAEMRRLKLEVKQTMDLYNTACKQALTAQQKASEIQCWKLEELRKLEEIRIAEEAALTVVEREKAKHRAAMEAAEASRKIIEFEAQKRMKAEMTSMMESEQMNNSVDSSFLIGSTRYRRYTVEEIEAATKGFSNSQKIGEGGFGSVYRTEIGHTAVAIKVLKPDAAQGRIQFQQEVDVLSSIRHPNMVLLLGACPEIGCLVYEYMANGSLDDCLFRRGNTPALPWQLRFRIAAEIATGLLFLHQAKPEALVHRDLKPGNILLDRNFVSKISDVGLSRLVPHSLADTVTQYRMTTTAGTFCYIDPEYQQTGMLGIKSDIYSLGIVLLQLVTGKPPMGLRHHVQSAIEKGTFAEMLDPAVESWPVEDALHLAKIALQCSEIRRKDRPDLGNVVLPELNKLRAFGEENMPMMMMLGLAAAYNLRSSKPSFCDATSFSAQLSRSTSSSVQDGYREAQSLSGMSGCEIRSSIFSQGRI